MSYTKAEREYKERERLYKQFGIIDSTPKFRPVQVVTLLHLIDAEKERLRKKYGPSEQASLAMAIVDLDQLAKKVKFHGQ